MVEGFFLRTLIIANGELTTTAADLRTGHPADRIIAVDGGYRHCLALGLDADTLIGDLDSLSAAELTTTRRAAITLLPFPAEKDETDLELALLHAVDLGASEITVLAALGGRIDMTLANLALLFHPALKDISVEYWHNGQRIWLIQPPGGFIRGAIGDTVSLLPFHGEAEGIDTKNLVYPLHDEKLTLGPARGVSNLLESEVASVSLESGALLVVLTKGRA